MRRITPKIVALGVVYALCGSCKPRDSSLLESAPEASLQNAVDSTLVNAFRNVGRSIGGLIEPTSDVFKKLEGIAKRSPLYEVQLRALTSLADVVKRSHIPMLEIGGRMIQNQEAMTQIAKMALSRPCRGFTECAHAVEAMIRFCSLTPENPVVVGHLDKLASWIDEIPNEGHRNLMVFRHGILKTWCKLHTVSTVDQVEYIGRTPQIEPDEFGGNSEMEGLKADLDQLIAAAEGSELALIEPGSDMLASGTFYERIAEDFLGDAMAGRTKSPVEVMQTLGQGLNLSGQRYVISLHRALGGSVVESYHFALALRTLIDRFNRQDPMPWISCLFSRVASHTRDFDPRNPYLRIPLSDEELRAHIDHRDPLELKRDPLDLPLSQVVKRATCIPRALHAKIVWMALTMFPFEEMHLPFRREWVRGAEAIAAVMNRPGEQVLALTASSDAQAKEALKEPEKLSEKEDSDLEKLCAGRMYPSDGDLQEAISELSPQELQLCMMFYTKASTDQHNENFLINFELPIGIFFKEREIARRIPHFHSLYKVGKDFDRDYTRATIQMTKARLMSGEELEGKDDFGKPNFQEFEKKLVMFGTSLAFKKKVGIEECGPDDKKEDCTLSDEEKEDEKWTTEKFDALAVISGRKLEMACYDRAFGFPGPRRQIVLGFANHQREGFLARMGAPSGILGLFMSCWGSASFSVTTEDVFFVGEAALRTLAFGPIYGGLTTRRGSPFQKWGEDQMDYWGLSALNHDSNPVAMCKAQLPNFTPSKDGSVDLDQVCNWGSSAQSFGHYSLQRKVGGWMSCQFANDKCVEVTNALKIFLAEIITLPVTGAAAGWIGRAAFGTLGKKGTVYLFRGMLNRSGILAGRNLDKARAAITAAIDVADEPLKRRLVNEAMIKAAVRSGSKQAFMARGTWTRWAAMAAFRAVSFTIAHLPQAGLENAAFYVFAKATWWALANVPFLDWDERKSFRKNLFNNITRPLIMGTAIFGVLPMWNYVPMKIAQRIARSNRRFSTRNFGSFMVPYASEVVFFRYIHEVEHWALTKFGIEDPVYEMMKGQNPWLKAALLPLAFRAFAPENLIKREFMHGHRSFMREGEIRRLVDQQWQLSRVMTKRYKEAALFRDHERTLDINIERMRREGKTEKEIRDAIELRFQAITIANSPQAMAQERGAMDSQWAQAVMQRAIQAKLATAARDFLLRQPNLAAKPKPATAARPPSANQQFNRTKDYKITLGVNEATFRGSAAVVARRIQTKARQLREAIQRRGGLSEQDRRRIEEINEAERVLADEALRETYFEAHDSWLANRGVPGVGSQTKSEPGPEAFFDHRLTYVDPRSAESN